MMTTLAALRAIWTVVQIGSDDFPGSLPLPALSIKPSDSCDFHKRSIRAPLELPALPQKTRTQQVPARSLRSLSG